MATLRELKKRAQAALSRSLTPAERLRRAAEMTGFAMTLRDAGLSYLGVSRKPRRRAKA